MSSAIKPGDICIVKAGRRSGEEVTVTKAEGNFVHVKTKKGRERKFSVLHLAPAEK